MPKKSSIKTKISAEARAYLEQLLREDRLSLDDMVSAVRDRFPEEQPISRSALHRYKSGFDELTARMREFESMADAVVGELGEGVGDKAGALLAQAITTLAANAALKAHETDDISIDEIRKLARAAKDAIDTRRISLAERQSLEKAAEARLLKEQRARLDSAVKRRGMSAEAAEEIRKEILGIA